MAFYRWVSFAVVIFLLLIGISNGEIHRAKAISTKTSKLKSRFQTTHVDASSEIRRELQELEELQRTEMNLTLSESTENLYVWVYSIGGAILVGLSGIFPLLVVPIEAGPALKHGAAANKLKLLLSFAVGGLLGDVFLHLLPEAWAHLHKGTHDHGGHTTIGLWILAGLLSFLIIEKIFGDDKEFEHLKDECDEINRVTSDILKNNKNTHKKDKKPINNNHVKETTNTKNSKNRHRKKRNVQHIQNGHALTDNDTGGSKSDKKVEDPQVESIKISGYLNLLANVIDNFTHGLAVAGSFLVSTKVGVITLIAILVHEIPHEVGDFAILLRSGFDRWKAAKAQICTASGGVLGALTALTAESAQAAGDATAWVLPFTSGGFIYIALVTVVPDLLEEKHGWESLKQLVFLVTGISSMFLVTVVFE